MKYSGMELGRSMVEMLGVLAIVGLLSIVGIAGYKKAMTRIYANDAIEMAQRFYAFVQEYVMVNPDEKGKDIYVRSGTNKENVTYLNLTDYMPAFANGNWNNYSIYIKIPKTTGNSTVLIYNIRKSGLCSTLFPNGTKSKKNSATDYNQLDQTIGTTVWQCRTAIDSNKVPVCDL